MSGTSLFRRLLGPDFDRLPPVLRRFHGSTTGGVSVGMVDVHADPQPWLRMAARLLHLPRPGHRVPVVVHVRPVGEREIWDRTFGPDRLRSIQWTEGGRLVEQVGAVTFAFDVSADATGMRFRLANVAALGMPVPRKLAVHVEADVVGFDNDWSVTVVVRTPGSRLLTSYSGRIAPTSVT